jgi:hypothetical protein
MGFSKTEIANMALSHIRIASEVSDLTTERSQEANTINRFWDVAREKILRKHDWPFATKFVALGLVSEDPTDEWRYSYQYPSDCLLIRRILSGARNDSRNSRESYKIVKGASGREIYTDREDAEIEYTVDETDMNQWPADLVLAMSYYLASLIAAPLTAGDPLKLGMQALALYNEHINEAVREAFGEEQPDREPPSEIELAREDLDHRSSGEDWSAYPGGAGISL